MTKRIVLATHSNLASGYKDALLFLAGEMQIHTICAYSSNQKPELELIQLLDSFDADDTVFVLTDLKGGSVNHIAAKLLTQHHFHLITGINLGLLLEIALLTDDMISGVAIKKAIASAKDDMCYMNELMDTLQEDLIQNEEEFFA